MAINYPWIPASEEDSPYYRRDPDTLMPFERTIHKMYCEGQVSIMSSDALYEASKKLSKEVERVRRENKIKQFKSEQDLANVVLNA